MRLLARKRREANSHKKQQRKKFKIKLPTDIGGKFVHFLKDVKEVFTGPTEDTTTSAVLSKVLHRHAVTIQSVVRMNHSRRAYVAKRVVLGLPITPVQRKEFDRHRERLRQRQRKEEKLQPLNPLHMLKGIRKLLKLRRNNMDVKACTKIQAVMRGYIVRNRIFREFSADPQTERQHGASATADDCSEDIEEVRVAADSSVAGSKRFRPALKIITDPLIIAAKNKGKNVPSVKAQVPPSPMAVAGKKMVKGMKLVSLIAEQRLGEAGESLSSQVAHSVHDAAGFTRDFLDRQKLHREM